ncbi:D-alanyl-D-alanine carboxypeptidase/D-alanyl-D-alanine-endopeptidase [Deinococcus cavernae]|uniref:D-alanyl-D-alanine carboxypeptidase/D-alanyl-D-alanine-endopeptidase n=1 Tax=Deinococcus cavernae TaxID=2320857 RepID=A0A418V7Q4_9DEIO|nr:D-alanyl-D-alanine carboxypeptidase/D-alanyl-D-alanine-endopeptidase [Deinococcus cavernae]RJF72117.1 D-alanyl-D-alanine carboxypeptidase/D-alanyl-D-alanine-endopeptidase [Deinococcus cavernae]
MRQRSALAAFVMLTAVMASVSSAQNAADPLTILERGPRKADGTPAARAHVGALVQDALTGEELLAWHDMDAFTPASTTKVVTTAAALYTLGADFTFKTAVLAPATSGERVERLTLRGTGDPTLREKGEGNTLETLAKAVAARGIRVVGEVRVDDFAFGQARWGNGWMWDDTEFPLGALRLDSDDATYLRLVVDSEEAKAGLQPNPALLTDASSLALSVGERLAALLRASGVEVGSVKRAKAEGGDTPVAEVSSAPLETLIRLTNKPSDNIYAEQLRAALGIGPDGTPSSETSASRTTGTFLKTAGYAGDDYRLRDGSGLTRYNLLTPRLLNTVLRFAYVNPPGTTLSAAEAFKQKKNLFIESLPVAGTGDATPEAKEKGGTLRNRLKDAGLDVRAKTGSMTGVASLSGYLTARSGRVLAFTLMMDNYPAGISDLNRWQDELVQALAAKY